MKNWKRIIGYIAATLMVVFWFLHWIMDLEWAEKYFWLFMCILCIYNLFFNSANKDMNSKQ